MSGARNRLPDTKDACFGFGRIFQWTTRRTDLVLAIVHHLLVFMLAGILAFEIGTVPCQ
jgi:hypothetical protein